MTDDELVDRVCKGETRLFEELVRRYQNVVYAMACRYVSSSDDAADVAQEAFVRAFRNMGSFRREARFSTWLYRITYNLCVDLSRQRGRTSVVSFSNEEAELLADPKRGIEEEAIANVEQTAIRHAAEGLDERYRSVIMMYYYDGLSYETIASVLGVQKKTVETRLYRARRLLRRALRGEIGGFGQ